MRFSCEKAQSSLEAALILPSFLVVLSLIMQPVFYLYTKCVMQEAAAEAVRAISTGGSSKESQVVDMVLRRLSVIPDISVFHSGGQQDWTVAIECSEGEDPTVTITGHIKPLPLFGPVAAVLADSDGLFYVEASASGNARPDWVSGTYSSWTSIWG